MQVNLPMSSRKSLTGWLLCAEVVSDHVDLFAARLIGHEVAEEGDELGRRVACCGLASTAPVLVLNAAYKESVPWR